MTFIRTPLLNSIYWQHNRLQTKRTKKCCICGLKQLTINVLVFLNYTLCYFSSPYFISKHKGGENEKIAVKILANWKNKLHVIACSNIQCVHSMNKLSYPNAKLFLVSLLDVFVGAVSWRLSSLLIIRKIFCNSAVFSFLSRKIPIQPESHQPERFAP